MTSIARFPIVNRKTFLGRRKELGWSQVELGHRSGYSERVIRKAEAGGTLRVETIKDLADAMSVDGRIITFADLTIDLELIAKRFVECYDVLGSGMLKECSDIFAEEFEFHCFADPKASIAGAWIGLTEFQEFLDQFFGTFMRRAGLIKPVYMVCEDHVVATWDDQVRYQGNVLPAYTVNFHFEFRNGELLRIDYEFDSLN